MLIPKDNEKQLEEVPEAIRGALSVVPVGHMDQVIEEALKVVAAMPPLQGRDDHSRPTDDKICH